MWKEVRTMSGTEVRIRTRRPRAVNTDGELSTHTPARFRVLPEAIVVLASRSAPTKPVQTDEITLNQTAMLPAIHLAVWRQLWLCCRINIGTLSHHFA